MRPFLLLFVLLLPFPASADPARDFRTTEEAYKGIGQLARTLRAQGNRRSLFAGVYALTIESTHEALARGEFRNPAWVRLLIVNYANIYRRTLQLELAGQRAKLPVAWQHAFGYIARTVPYAEEGKETWSADLDAVYGIHVHIARDLVEALFVTSTDFRSASVQADFFHITEALRGTMPAIYAYFSSFRGGFSPLFMIEQNVMMGWIADLRRDAWANAAAYTHLNGAQKRSALSQLDRRVESRSRRHGGLLPLLPR